MTQLAKQSGISYAYLNYLIHGEDPKTGRPPSPSIDKLLAISKALNVPIMSLITAYQGKNPDIVNSSSDTEVYKEATRGFIQALPEEEAFALLDRMPPEVLRKRLERMEKGQGC